MERATGRIFAFAILALLLAGAGFALVPQGQMKIYAVTSDGQGLVATLDLKIEPGTGKIWSSVTPLVGTTTQNAEKAAVKVAQKYFSATSKYDYKFSINSSASAVDGPSAGAAMTLLTVALLTDRPVPDNVSLTGTISEDGRVGPVGGVYEKAKEASRVGTKLFLIPKGEAIQTVKLPEGVTSVNILDYAPKSWGMKVAEVQTLDDAIELAYSRIEDIDVNSEGAKAIPEFVPEKLRLNQKTLGPFKVLTTNYLKKTKKNIAIARNSLSSSLLEDGELTHDLVEILNNSEQTAGRSDVLNEQNYLYSAANFAFLANVNALIVSEVSDDPKLLDPDSSSLDIKLVELRRELSNFEDQLSGDVPKEGVEWYASAQQRFTYAKNTVEKLSTEQTVVVKGLDSDAKSGALARLRDYAFAVAWLDVAKDFYSLAKQDANPVKSPTGALQQSADMAISDAKKYVSKLDDKNPSKPDISRRLEAAKKERDLNWLEAAMFDASSARALARAEQETADMNHDDLRGLLNSKITSIEKAWADSNSSSGWSALYLAHSKYFLSSANYYDKSSLTETSSDNLKSGYGLALLAEEESAAAAKIVGAYASLVPERPKEAPAPFSPVPSSAPPGFSNRPVLGLVLAIGALFAIILAGILGFMIATGKKDPLAVQISRSREMLKAADEQFMAGAISKEGHNAMKRKYEQEIASLDAQRKARANHIVAVDEYSAGIESYSAKIRELKRHFKEGTVTAGEFSAKSAEYLAATDALKSSLEQELKEAPELAPKGKALQPAAQPAKKKERTARARKRRRAAK